MEKKAEKLVIAALSDNETNGPSHHELKMFQNFGGRNFGKSMQFHQIRQNFPPPKFCAIRYLLSVKMQISF